MPEISRNALLPYPAAFMYDIVNQVEAYPEFLPWCLETRVTRREVRGSQAAPG